MVVSYRKSLYIWMITFWDKLDVFFVFVFLIFVKNNRLFFTGVWFYLFKAWYIVSLTCFFFSRLLWYLRKYYLRKYYLMSPSRWKKKRNVSYLHYGTSNVWYGFKSSVYRIPWPDETFDFSWDMCESVLFCFVFRSFLSFCDKKFSSFHYSIIPLFWSN